MKLPLLVIDWLLRRRYRITEEGLDQVRKLRDPILFLFEHPAQVDAFLLASVLARASSKQRPLLPKYLAARDFYLLPIIHGLVKETILPVPEEGPRRRRIFLLRLLIDRAVEVLKGGGNLALSPVGALIRGNGLTQMGSKTGVAQILQNFESGEVAVVTVKFEGLYGSSTSRALVGQSLRSRPASRRLFRRGFVAAPGGTESTAASQRLTTPKNPLAIRAASEATDPLVDAPPDPRQLGTAIRAFLKGFFLLSRRREVNLIFNIHSDFPVGKKALVPDVNSRLEQIFSEKRLPVYLPYNRIDGLDLRGLPRPGPKEIHPEATAWSKLFIRAAALTIAAWPEKEVGLLLSNAPLEVSVRRAIELAGKRAVNFDPRNPNHNLPKVLTSELTLNELAATQRMVFPDLEESGFFVDVATLIDFRGIILGFLRIR